MILQAAAWAGMILDYSRTYGAEQGLSKTFDGAHPCALCCKVKQGREHEQKQSALKSDFKFDKNPPIYF
jgi:hypothetical protein